MGATHLSGNRVGDGGDLAPPRAREAATSGIPRFTIADPGAELVSRAGEPVVLGLAVAYGGLAQLLAGMWEFRTGNTFGAVAFSSFGAFWISFFVYVAFFARAVPAADAGHAVGLYLIGWGIFTTYMLVVSLRTPAAIALVFLLLAATFFLLGIGNANGDDSIVKIGGWVGLATAAAAWYASFAAVTNATFGRILLPVMPLRRAEE
jgi:uncharacterized protein